MASNPTAAAEWVVAFAAGLANYTHLQEKKQPKIKGLRGAHLRKNIEARVLRDVLCNRFDVIAAEVDIDHPGTSPPAEAEVEGIVFGHRCDENGDENPAVVAASTRVGAVAPAVAAAGAHLRLTSQVRLDANFNRPWRESVSLVISLQDGERPVHV